MQIKPVKPIQTIANDRQGGINSQAIKLQKEFKLLQSFYLINPQHDATMDFHEFYHSCGYLIIFQTKFQVIHPVRQI